MPHVHKGSNNKFCFSKILIEEWIGLHFTLTIEISHINKLVIVSKTAQDTKSKENPKKESIEKTRLLTQDWQVGMALCGSQEDYAILGIASCKAQQC
jgi:hypothetical protein